MTLRRDWRDIVDTMELRQQAARNMLGHLLERTPAGRSRGADLLAESTMGLLMDSMRVDGLSRPVRNAVGLRDRALMWLHEQEVIRLNKGLTVLRPAMTIRLSDERRNFRSADFQPLQIHYDEKTVQIHIAQWYAERGLDSMGDALQLVVDYFVMSQEEFLDKWLSGSKTRLKVQSTADSWRRIVDRLGNTQQRRVVIDDRETVNTLVLAGPGSGKTMVLVHRVAYLVRIRREKPRSIVVLAYNRHAAIEIRQRLRALIGDEANGVIVMTCHGLAMRLTGESFAGRARSLTEADFRDCLRRATSLLRGDGLPGEEADDLRERLMGGFRWLLVDEFHDVGAGEFSLISALAARARGEEEDRRVSLLVVGMTTRISTRSGERLSSTCGGSRRSMTRRGCC